MKIPKFLPVQLSEKEVKDWEDLDRARAKRAPVLGLDDWGEVLKYNIASLLFCDLCSKAFCWVIISVGMMVYFRADKSSLLTYNAIGSLLHFAAKDEFKKFVAAICSRWSGQPQGTINGNPATAASSPVISK